MTTAIVEQRLTLTFDTNWRALKWDAQSPTDPPPYLYREGIERLKGQLDRREESTKAVDVVASSSTPELTLIEIKDFRTDWSVGAPRSVTFGGRWQELPLEVALKVRDTLAGIYGVAQSTSDANTTWLRDALTSGVRVYAFVLQDAVRPSETHSKRNARDSELRNNLRRRLAWLTTDRQRVNIVDPIAEPIPRPLTGLTVTSR